MKKFLSLILLFTLIAIMPLSASAAGQITFDNDGTSNWFFGVNDRLSTATKAEITAATYVYNGSASAISNSSVTISGITYSLSGLTGTGTSRYDSYKVASDSGNGLIIDIDENEKINRIWFIAVAGNPTNPVTVTPKLKYKGDSVYTDVSSVEVKTSTTKSSNYVSMGNALVEGSNKTAESTVEAFLNAYEITPSNKEVDSVQFPAAASDYYIIAVTTVPYFFDSAAVKTVIDTHYANYLGGSVDFTTFTDDDLTNIQTLRDTLESLKDAADSDLTDKPDLVSYKATAEADMATLDKLVSANAIYKEKNPIYTAIQNLYSNTVNGKTYLEIANDIENAPFNAFSTDATTHLTSLISEYEKAIDKEASWANYADYCADFGITDNCVIDTTEKAKIEALKTAYIKYLNVEAENLAARNYLDGISASELQPASDGTFTETQESTIKAAITHLNTLKKNGADTSAYNDFNTAIKLYNMQYDTYVDLSDFVNVDLIVKNNSTIPTHEEWLAQSTSPLFNSPSSNKVTSASGNIYYLEENGYNSTMVVDENDPTKIISTGYDAVRVSSGDSDLKFVFDDETNPQKNIESVNFILESQSAPDINNTSCRSAVTVTVKYKDGTETKGTAYAYRRDSYYATRGFGDSKISTNFGRINLTNSDGSESTKFLLWTKAGYNGCNMLESTVEVDHTKEVESITLAAPSSNSYNLIAMTVNRLTNSELVNTVTTVANTGYTAETLTAMQVSEIETAVEYYEILTDRGLSVSSSVETALKEKIALKNANCASISKRINKSTIETTVYFTGDVAITSDMISSIKATKTSGETTTNVATAFVLAADGKSATLTITDETRSGGNVYNISVPKMLSVRLYKNETEGNYEYSYTVPDYSEVSYDASGIKVKNNSQDTINYYAAVVATDNGTVVEAKKETGSLSAVSGNTPSVKLTKSGTYSTVLWNDVMQTISSDAKISKCTATPVVGADYNNPVLNLSTNIIKVSGYTKSAASDKVVNLRLNKNNHDGDLLYAGTVKTGEKGYFEFNITLSEPLDGSGYDIYFNLGGDDYNAIQQIANTIYVCSNNDKESYISDLKAGTVLATDIPTLKDSLAVDFEPANILTDAEFASYLNENKADFTGLTISDIGKIQTTIKTLSILAVFEKETAEAENALFNGTAFKHDDIIGYSGIDSNGATLWSIYNNSISLTGQEAVKDALLGESYADTAALLEAVKEQIFINALKNPPVDAGGTAYITNLLTTTNDTALKNISYSKFNGTSAFIDAIATAIPSFNTASDVASFIANYTPTTTNPGGNQGGGNLGGGGGGGSWNSGMSFDTVDIPLDDSQPVAPAEKTSIFTDVSADHWAYVNIVSLFDKKIISGKALGIFAPDDSLTRGELVKMLCTAYNLKAQGGSPFADTNEKWYNEYAAAAFENGLVKGISETEFGGDAPITRQDLCTILYRIKNEAVTTELTFTDSDSVSEYAVSAVAYMNSKQIISGFTDGSFRPDEICSRAQCAKIIDLFLNLQ